MIIKISDSKFINGNALIAGGGIIIYGGINVSNNVNLKNLIFSNCSANEGGIYTYTGNGAIANINISNSDFINCTSSNDGGIGITTSANGNTNVNIFNSSIGNNNTEKDDNEIYISAGENSSGNSSVNLNDVTFIITSTTSTRIVSNGTVGKPTTINGVVKDRNANPLANINITVTIDGEAYNLTTNNNGEWSLTFTPTRTGNFSIIASSTCNNIYAAINETASFNVAQTEPDVNNGTKISTNTNVNLPSNVKVGNKFAIKATITDTNGKGVAGATVNLYQNEVKIGSAVTNSNGVANSKL